MNALLPPDFRRFDSSPDSPSLKIAADLRFFEELDLDFAPPRVPRLPSNPSSSACNARANASSESSPSSSIRATEGFDFGFGFVDDDLLTLLLPFSDVPGAYR